MNLRVPGLSLILILENIVSQLPIFLPLPENRVPRVRPVGKPDRQAVELLPVRGMLVITQPLFQLNNKSFVDLPHVLGNIDFHLDSPLRFVVSLALSYPSIPHLTGNTTRIPINRRRRRSFQVVFDRLLER